ncbi:MAG: KAP family NTPase [Flavobacteriales bacterium]|nr:KAP family NTPase [Flavobacteriales bacterium]
MWSDNETTEDLLGFRVHADLILNVIKDEAVLPTTIGVFGDWGSGKSSILKIVHDELVSDNPDILKDDTLVLYFNGWVFEGYDDAKAAILESIVKAFDDHKTLGHKVKDETTKLLKSVQWMRLLGLGFKNIALPVASAYATGGLSLLGDMAQKMGADKFLEKVQGSDSEEFLKSIIKKEEDDVSTLVREFRNEFKSLLDKSSIKRLVIIIDDLDRCAPDRIIENLEAIKLFLNVEKTAFVIGADPRVVRHAIEYRYKTDNRVDNENTRIVDDYLEKLIQIPYYLPKLSEPEVETYMSMLICKSAVSPVSFSSVLNEFHAYRIKDRYSAFGLSNFQSILEPAEHEQVKQNIITIPSLAPLIAQSLYGNPRQIKRFLNTYTLRKRLAGVASMSEFNDAVLAKLMILEYTELRLFKNLFDWQLIQKGHPAEIGELEDFCKDVSLEEAMGRFGEKYKDWAKPKIVTWLALAPSFSDIDLSDYFWISRDRVTASISGSSLVSPMIKTLANKLNQDVSQGVVDKIIESEVLPLTSIDRDAFLEYFQKMFFRNPDKDNLHKVFITMINKSVSGAAASYTEVLQKVAKSTISPAIGLVLNRLKDHPEVGGFLTEYFKGDGSKTGKAFNLNNSTK